MNTDHAVPIFPCERLIKGRKLKLSATISHNDKHRGKRKIDEVITIAP